MPQLLPSNSFGFVLTDLARVYRQVIDKAVMDAGIDLTSGEIRALAHAARHQGSRQAVLAERLGVEPMTLSAYLDRLETRGLIERSVDPSDRRAKIITPTDKADQVFNKVRPIVLQVYQRMSEGLGEGEMAAVQSAMERMRDNLVKEISAPSAEESASSLAGKTETA